MTDDLGDFDKKMDAIDKAMADMPGTPEPPAVPAKTRRIAPAGLPEGGRREVVSVGVRLILVTLLAGGLTMWPYFHDCGLGLAAYLAALGVTVGTGAWTAVSTWRLRLGIPHIVSLIVTLGGLGLLAHEVAQRVGYAAAAQTWFCP